ADFNPDVQQVADFLAADRRVITSGEPLFIEEPVTSSSGETHWLQTTKAPIVSADGKSKYVLGVATDITARRNAEEALRHNEELLRTVLENFPIGVWIVDATGTITHGNSAGKQIWMGAKYIGLEAFGEYKGWWADTGKRIAAVEWAVARAISKGETSLNEEIEIEAFDGVRKYILNSAIPIFDLQQTIQGAIIVNQDITERKQNEKRIREAFEKEKELGELKSRFVLMASHEFRTPLASILALTETLLAYRHRLADEQIEQRLGKIQEQVGHLKAIMEDVLQLARLQARRTEFNPTLLNLDSLCRTILDEFQSQSDEAHHLLYICNDALYEMKLDKKLIRQAINNLVSNALKYSPADSTIMVNLSYTSEALVLTVRDEGIGIPAPDLDHLFEPFHRAVNVGTISGTGLGLVIAKEAIELHSGTITVESQVGIGTAFTITIPLFVSGANDHDENIGN
ncbi:MAG: PAS domain-containing sensor histidine kinase, partial [Limisphaerales bacterium]